MEHIINKTNVKRKYNQYNAKRKTLILFYYR